jgi:TonB family protein
LLIACAGTGGRPDYTPPGGCELTIEECRHLGCDGWIELEFDVTPAGAVENPVVLAACPPGYFEEAALKAVAGWEYPPSQGKPRTRVRLDFEQDLSQP